MRRPTSSPTTASERRMAGLCVVADCAKPGAVPLSWVGELCEPHADAAWYEVEKRDALRFEQDIVGAEGRDYMRDEFRKQRKAARAKPTALGEIYFVQIDDLIKVGWTSKLAERIRAYGPKAILLANYPGTRKDEAALHRQLVPARFRGREWYVDGPIIRAFIDEAVAKHGPPRFDAIPWTEPKGTPTKPRYWR